MARLVIKTPDFAPAEIQLKPGCNCLGREGENDFLLAHASVSRRHCEVWLMEDAVLVRDLSSRNGTFIDDGRVEEAALAEGQTLRVGEVEMMLAEAPVRISVPDLPLPAPAKAQLFLPDGIPSCMNHNSVAAELECTGCRKVFCAMCVRELRVSGGVPHRFCPACGGPCEPLVLTFKPAARPGWIERLVKAITKPSKRKRK